MTDARFLEIWREELYRIKTNIEDLEVEFAEAQEDSFDKEFFKVHLTNLKDQQAQIENKIREVRHKIIMGGGQCDE